MHNEGNLTSLNVSLPRTQRAFVESEASRSGCTTSSEYIRRLIHEAQRRAAQEELELRLIAGLESGECVAVTPEYWDQKRRELAERHSRNPT